jgi:3-deoxy-D-manno-octulosonic-acid transferase
MTAKLLRLALMGEFLLAMAVIFIAWPEIGGENALEAMHWGWKLGFGLALSIAFVAFTAAIAQEEAFWTLRAARWLAAIVALVAAMVVITYYYSLQEDTDDSDESNTISAISTPAPLLVGIDRTIQSPIRVS